MGEAEKKIENISKTSKNILYSTQVFGEKENEINPEIIMKDLKKEDENDQIGTFLILKYNTLKGIPLQVIIATLDKINDRKNRVEKINELIKSQLRDNANEEEGYKYYEELREYLKTEGIPLNLTPEGTDILSTKSDEEKKFTRTICENSNGKVKQLYTNTQLKEMRRNNMSEIDRHNLWLEGKQAILKNLKTEKERQDFLKGEEIAQIIKGTDIDNIDAGKKLDEKMKNRKRMVTEYLLDIYEGKNITVQSNEKQMENQQKENKLKLLKAQLEKNNFNSENQRQQNANNLELVNVALKRIEQERVEYEKSIKEKKEEEEQEQALLMGYLEIKEKGLAIDINVFLEKLEAIINNKIQKQIDKQKGETEISPNDYREIKILQNYHHFFSFVKNGIDRSARVFAMATEKLDFEILKRLMTKFNGHDQEILQYIDVKQKMLDETKTEDIKNKERYYPSVRELYTFLLDSGVREVTKKDDEEMSATIFEKAKEKLLKNYAKEISLYNRYARKFGAYVCPVQGNENENMNDTMHKDNNLEEKNKANQSPKIEEVYQNIDNILEDANRRMKSNNGLQSPEDKNEGR